MIFKRFRLQCTIRVLCLGASLTLSAVLWFHTTFYATTILVGVLVGYQLYALIHYVEQTNRDLSRFFDAVRHADFSQSFVTPGLGASFDELKQAMHAVQEAFSQTRAENEAHLRYVETVVQHIGSGLIAFRADGTVDLLNAAAKRLLNIPRLHHIAELESQHPLLVQSLRELTPGQRLLAKIHRDQEQLQLAVHTTAFRLQDQAYTLVSLQNIQSELDDKETEAWQNLIRVLTHEIMNSITPIASLASTAHGILSAPSTALQNAAIDAETHQDLVAAVYTIQKRSEGLLHFVEAYRRLSRIPPPQLQYVLVAELFRRLEPLIRPQLEAAGIDFHIDVASPTLELMVDPDLIEQVLLNLLRNALEAATSRTLGLHVTLAAGLENSGQVSIQVRDNGPGIVAEALEKIFIPFFTTKPDGSGIGLSLSRQIMRLHRGTIRVHSQPGVDTVFTLTF